MRAIGVMRYHLRRHFRKVLIFFAIMLVMAVGSALVSMSYGRTISMEFVGGGYQVGESYAGSALYSDPSSFTNSSLFSAFVCISALYLIFRERRFMVSISVTRHEALAGSFLYLTALSAIMTLMVWLISVVGYLALWALGYRTGASVTVQTLLAGNWPALLVAFTSMVADAGVYTLFGYMMARWWKVILSLFAAMIALIILLTTQINILNHLGSVREMLEGAITWIFEVAVPAIIDYFSETRAPVIALRNLAIGVAMTALSYPVMRGMKVVK